MCRRCMPTTWGCRPVRSAATGSPPTAGPKGSVVTASPTRSHYILAGIPDDQVRFETIDAPPLDERARVRRWTTGLAKKHVGQLPDRPETPAQKVAAIHRLADDDEVAAQVATDVLRRPAVAAIVVADDPPHGRRGADHAARDRDPRRLTRRTARPAERRDVSPYYLAQAA